MVVAHDRPRDLSGCSESVLRQTEPNLELVVVLNDPTPAVRSVAAALEARDRRVRVVSRGGLSASHARNHGVQRASAPVLYFVDDDASIPAGGVAAALSVLEEHPEVAILGGPNLTPIDDPPFAHACGAVLASAWGTSIARSRYARHPAGPATERDLILCNLVIRRTVFDAGPRPLRFPTLFGGEENILLGRAQEAGHQMWYSPDVWVHHRRRSSPRGYVSQIFRYGRGRATAMRSASGTSHPAHFVPLFFAAYLVALPAVVLFEPWTVAPLLAYGVGTVLATLGIVVRWRRPSWMLAVMGIFIATHLAYAAGLAYGLIRRRRHVNEDLELQHPVTREQPID